MNQDKGSQEKGTEDFGGDNDFIDLNGEDEFEFTNSGGENKEDDEFDGIVGALQDIVMDPEFEEQQKEFLEKNCMIFDDDEENKIEYMGIFKEYQDKLETYIEKKIEDIRPGSDMKKFFTMIETRIDEIDPQLLDMLLTFTDFQLFKEHMLAHKKLQLSIKKKSKKFEEFKQDKGYELSALEQDLSSLVVSGQPKHLHSEKEREAELPKQQEVKPKKEKVENKTQTKGKAEKEATEADLAKFTHKKTSNKADPEYKAKKKDNIFS